jgi:uncharacterized protein YbjT (DUF2867 family)
MKILITGASGNVGQYIVKNLLGLNEDLVLTSTNPEKLSEMYYGAAEIVYFDFQKVETFDQALINVDRVYLMRPPHLGKPEDLYPFLSKLKEYSVKHIVFLSLMGIERNPIPPHYKIEKYIKKLGIPYTFVRPGFFMQNISGIHSYEIRERDEIFVPAGKSKTSFIDTKDIGYAISIILHKPFEHINKAYTLTGSVALDYYELANILSEVTERKIIYRNPSFIQYRNYYINHRKLDKSYVNVTIGLYLITRMGNAKKVTNDYFTITGKKPTSFYEFCEHHLEDFKR